MWIITYWIWDRLPDPSIALYFNYDWVWAWFSISNFAHMWQNYIGFMLNMLHFPGTVLTWGPWVPDSSNPLPWGQKVLSCASRCWSYGEKHKTMIVQHMHVAPLPNRYYIVYVLSIMSVFYSYVCETGFQLILVGQSCQLHLSWWTMYDPHTFNVSIHSLSVWFFLLLIMLCFKIVPIYTILNNVTIFSKHSGKEDEGGCHRKSTRPEQKQSLILMMAQRTPQTGFGRWIIEAEHIVYDAEETQNGHSGEGGGKEWRLNSIFLTWNRQLFIYQSMFSCLPNKQQGSGDCGTCWFVLFSTQVSSVTFVIAP